VSNGGIDRQVADEHAAAVRAAVAGDRAALETVLASHLDQVHAVCRSLCRDPADAEDATQEALIAIARSIGRFDGRSRFSTWCHRIAVNASIDELRRRKRRPDPVDLSESFDHTQDRPDLDPEAHAIGTATRQDLRAALNDLPEEFRVPVLLRDVADLDYAEIAEILDVPPGTVRSRIARGRGRLADALSGAGRPDPGRPDPDRPSPDPNEPPPAGNDQPSDGSGTSSGPRTSNPRTRHRTDRP
jgi:RNA polymerase sigma-70 factor, ECF subfamily